MQVYLYHTWIVWVICQTENVQIRRLNRRSNPSSYEKLEHQAARERLVDAGVREA